jgi:hypothetical protein
MANATPISPPRQLVRLLSKLQTSEIVSPLDTESELKQKYERLKLIASRLDLREADFTAIKEYLSAVLATDDNAYMTSVWHSLVGYTMSVGEGPGGRNFIKALFRAFE